MTDINVVQDLGMVTEQIQKAMTELQEVDGQRQQLIQQIQNLNGVAMYLRGKESPESPEAPEAPEAIEVSGDTDKEP